MIERPNKLHAEYSGDLRDHTFWYDGETITVMDRGAIIAEGTPGDIERNPEVQRAYLGR